jgi:DUF971 family protein
MIPVQLKVVGSNFLYIKWNDDSESNIKLANLRRYCPCSLCAAEREEQGTKYIPIYAEVQLKIKNISVVGNYAVGIIWTDDHNTGIYDFSYLKKISNL